MENKSSELNRLRRELNLRFAVQLERSDANFDRIYEQNQDLVKLESEIESAIGNQKLKKEKESLIWEIRHYEEVLDRQKRL